MSERLIYRTCPKKGTKHMVFHNWVNGGDLTFLRIESEEAKVLRVVNEETGRTCTLPKAGLCPMGSKVNEYKGLEHYYPAAWFIQGMSYTQKKALGRIGS